MPDLVVLGHADLILNETCNIKKFYPSIKFCQWFLDKMDDHTWVTNKKRFFKKIPYLDFSFCTTHPKGINSINTQNIKFIPNPVDESFENLKIYKKKEFKYDLFFALSHGVHRGTLKKGKKIIEKFF